MSPLLISSTGGSMPCWTRRRSPPPMWRRRRSTAAQGVRCGADTNDEAWLLVRGGANHKRYWCSFFRIMMFFTKLTVINIHFQQSLKNFIGVLEHHKMALAPPLRRVLCQGGGGRRRARRPAPSREEASLLFCFFLVFYQPCLLAACEQYVTM